MISVPAIIANWLRTSGTLVRARGGGFSTHQFDVSADHVG